MSSAASTASPRSACGDAATGRGADTASRFSATVKWNVLPRPTTLSTQIRPPICSTSWREIASPSPVPPKRRVVEASACAKASKMTRLLSAGMPMPVSAMATRKVTASGVTASASTCTETSPRSVNLIALPTRLRRIWPSRPVSPIRSSGTSAWIS